MLKLCRATLASSLVAGCAYIPALEPEDTFSYAEIATQIECETYFAAVRIAIDEQSILHHDPGYSDPTQAEQDRQLATAFDTWNMSLTIKPSLNYDSSLNLGFNRKTSAAAKDYFEFALGGGTAPGGAAYEMYGTADADDIYIFPLKKLFDVEHEHIKTDPYQGRFHEYYLPRINQKRLSSVCSPFKDQDVTRLVRSMVDSKDHSLPTSNIIHQNAVPNILDSTGIFGIYDFLNRSFAVDNTLDILPKSITFDKEYKIKVSVGITPGWYVALGSEGGNAGVLRTIDNDITLAFSPPDNAGGGKAVVETKLVKTPRGKIAVRKVIQPGPDGNNGVSPASAQTLLNATTSIQLQSIQNKLNELTR